MNEIAITAGGTSEAIDGVRKITNLSTGSLAQHCLDAVFEHFKRSGSGDFIVHYIHSENAMLRALNDEEKVHVNYIPVTDAASVYKAVDQLTRERKIDYFIHSMAISDFTFSYAADIYRLARELTGFSTLDGADEIKVIEALRNPASQLQKGEKIPSDEDIVIGLKRTQKVIPLIKQNNPATFLVGFKLLNKVGEAELLEAARYLSEQNGCDLVLANEASAIGESNHRGLLVREGEIILRVTGKQEIAQAIINEMFK